VSECDKNTWLSEENQIFSSLLASLSTLVTLGVFSWIMNGMIIYPIYFTHFHFMVWAISYLTTNVMYIIIGSFHESYLSHDSLGGLLSVEKKAIRSEASQRDDKNTQEFEETLLMRMERGNRKPGEGVWAMEKSCQHKDVKIVRQSVQGSKGKERNLMRFFSISFLQEWQGSSLRHHRHSETDPIHAVREK
jgi:hypothetical protein